jgi:hypothetical protein
MTLRPSYNALLVVISYPAGSTCSAQVGLLAVIMRYLRFSLLDRRTVRIHASNGPSVVDECKLNILLAHKLSVFEIETNDILRGV